MVPSRFLLAALAVLGLCECCFGPSAELRAASSRLEMKDGRVLTGAFATVESVVNSLDSKRNKDEVPSERIIVIDDQLRQTYVPKNAVADIESDDIGASLEIFKIHQPISRAQTSQLVSIGSFRSAEPFDEFGRRTILVSGSPLVQGITEITPRYVRIQGINRSLDMRVSPHNFSRSTLTALMKRSIDPSSIDERLRIYQFYVQAELFEQAAEELEEIIADFKDDEENTRRLSVGLRMIRQLAAERLITELQLRLNAGQHRKVGALLASFDEQGVSFEKIQTIRRMIQQSQTEETQRRQTIEKLNALAAQLDNEEMKAEIAPILQEIERELNANTQERFSEFSLSANDAALDGASRLAIGLSGWLVGNIEVDSRLELALSMYRLRQLVRKYLLESNAAARDELWEAIRSEEAATPARTARIVQLMKPPQSTRSAERETPGFYELETPSFESGKTIRYCVQLPPEYDPNRKYPLIVTLHSEATSPEQQIDWWAGSWKNYSSAEPNANDAAENVPAAARRERYGQAGRFGYIVLAPQWAEGNDIFWDCSPAQSAAVLYALRDASRRFSIHSDRVFLTGHSAGAAGVWDLGLSHPDLWAGLIPICAPVEKYPLVLRKNAEFVPVYGVGGELDGGRLAQCKSILDDGMARGVPFDMTYALFKGRGNESFSDEIIRIFQWMQLRTRNFFPNSERTVYSMRPWDHFFWNVELFGFSDKNMVLPINWVGELPKPFFPASTEFFRSGPNVVRIKSKADSVTVFLSPEEINFEQRVEIFFNGKKISPANGVILPNVRVMLEDARTRCDRQHPFWAMVDSRRPNEPNFWDTSNSAEVSEEKSTQTEPPATEEKNDKDE